MWNWFAYLLLGWDRQWCKIEIFWFKFFWHAVAKGLSKQFKEITKVLVSTKISQTPMDDSNINLKYYEALKQEHNENLFLSLIDIDTFSLHSVRSNLIWYRNNILGYKGNPCRCISFVAWLPSPTWRFWSCYKFKQVSTLSLCYKMWQNQRNGWSIAGNLDQYARYQILEQISKIQTTII